MEAEIITILGIALTLKDIGMLVLWVLGTLISIIFFSLFLLRKHYRQFKNLSKPILFINLSGSNSNDFSAELKLFRESGFFNVSTPVNNLNSIRNGDTSYGFVIVGLISGSVKDFGDLLTTLNNLKCPSMIYTFGDSTALTPEQFKEAYKYTKVGISNSSTRLIGDVFNILSVYPNEK